MLGFCTMGLFERWMFYFVIVAAHWVNGPVAYKDTEKPCDPRPGQMLFVGLSDQMRRPAIKPKPVLTNPGQQGFAPVKLQKPPLHPFSVFPPVYPKFKPSRVLSNTKTQSGLSEDFPKTQPSQRPSLGPGQKPPYWVKVPSPWYLNKRHPFRYVPGSSFQKPTKQLSKPNVLTEKTTVPPREEFPMASTPRPQPQNVRFVQAVRPLPSKKDAKECTTTGKPQVPKYQGIKVIKLKPYKDENEHLLDSPDPSFMQHSPDRPPFVQHNFIPFLPRYYVTSPPQWHSTEEPNYERRVYPVLQKQQIPRLEWSWERRHWIPRFPTEEPV